MDRHHTYAAFWLGFIKTANETPALLQAHGSINAAKNHSEHYLELRRNGILFRYSIYWHKYTDAYVTAGETAKQVKDNCQEVPDTTGQLKTMNPDRWPSIYQKMIQAMLDLASKLVIKT